jgi:hypothetical protein
VNEHLTRNWWVCLCDSNANVRHLTVREWLGMNRLELLQGADRELPVAFADSLENSQAAGRIVKSQLLQKKEKAQGEA